MEEERNRLKRDTIERKKKSPKSAFAIVGAKRKRSGAIYMVKKALG